MVAGDYGETHRNTHSARLTLRWQTVYAHMDHIQVRRGDKVKVGQKLGRVSNVGAPQGPHLLANFLRQAGEGEASRLDDASGSFATAGLAQAVGDGVR